MKNLKYIILALLSVSVCSTAFAQIEKPAVAPLEYESSAVGVAPEKAKKCTCENPSKNLLGQFGCNTARPLKSVTSTCKGTSESACGGSCAYVCYAKGSGNNTSSFNLPCVWAVPTVVKSLSGKASVEFASPEAVE